ncbi:MAG: AAA family ATPase [Mycobacteriales bacterium]
MGVITISAAYAAGGSEIGPAVAHDLGVQFYDRAISQEVAAKLGVTEADVEQREGRNEGRFWRLLASMAIVPDPTGANPLAGSGFGDEREYRVETERVLRQIASAGGVVLGRAAAVVLADHPDALHVRLTAPKRWRIAEHARIEGIPGEQAKRDVEQNDRAREGYVKQLYRADPRDPKHYHLVIDTGAFSWPAATELIVQAARHKGIAG